MVRSYLRHGQTERYGLIASPNAAPVFTSNNLAFVPALEDILVWDLKLGECVGEWHETGHRALVTCLVQNPVRPSLFAVGYADGSVRIWNSQNKGVVAAFNGHQRQITALVFSADGARLASGSQDNDIILWDVVAETGLFRLRGHKNQITALLFVSEDHLVSSSKDTLLKLWHLPTQHCQDTAVAHRSECWSITQIPDQEENSTEAILVTSGSEGEIKVWQIALRQPGMDEPATRSIQHLGAPKLSSVSHAHRISRVLYDKTTSMLGVQTSERSVELVRIRSLEEVKRKTVRKRKRKGVETETLPTDDEEVSWPDRLASYSIVRSLSKIHSFAFAAPASSREARGKLKTPSVKSEAHLLLLLNNNSLQSYTVPLPNHSQPSATSEPTQSHAVALPGHRSDVRALAVSSDDALIASVSNGEVKVWNRRSLKCLRTMTEGGYALCASWLPGDRHLLVGTKSGALELYDISASTCIQNLTTAHSGAVSSLALRPDGKSFVTGSADKSVKFWDFEVRQVESGQGPNQGETATTKALTIIHVKTLKMTDDVLAVKYSPDSRLLAVSLLDATVKVFFADTLKFFLSLYGHKLPVLSMDISFDSKLIITCAADKNVKIWGLDFGDCHRSLFAHEDSIMQTIFEADSHYFWTVGKDKMVKYWDGDKFECIQKLDGHHGEIWALAASHKGRFVVTAGSDKSIRIWEKTEEPLFLEEERERELEQLYESNMPQNDEFALVVRKDGVDTEPQEATDVRKQTVESLTAGERIMEALELSVIERLTMHEYRLATAENSNAAPPPRNPILAMLGPEVSSEAYVLQVVQKVPSAALQDALLVLPFSKIGALVEHLDHWAQQRWNIALTSRILFFILRNFHSQIVATRTMRDTLQSMRHNLREALQQQKDLMGYNSAALGFLKRRYDEQKTTGLLERDSSLTETEIAAKLSENSKKRKRAVQ